MKFVSRASNKLQFALDTFKISVKGKVCADFGSAIGGFVDCLLKNGCKRVYAVEVGYGLLDWNLRKNPKVVVLERKNAMHVSLPEKVDLISIDVGWTKQKYIIPNSLANLKNEGIVISLIKPQYEADSKYLIKGRLDQRRIDEVLQEVRKDIESAGGNLIKMIESPILGEKGKNKEFLALVKKNKGNLRGY